MKIRRNVSLILLPVCLAAATCSVNSPKDQTGIPECDKLFAKVNEKTSDKNFNANSNKGAAYKFIRDDIMPGFRKALAKPDANRKELGEQCKTAYDNFVPPDDR